MTAVQQVHESDHGFLESMVMLGWPPGSQPGTYQLAWRNDDPGQRVPVAKIAWSPKGETPGGYLFYVRIYNGETDPDLRTEAALNPDGSVAFARVRGQPVPLAVFVFMVQSLMAECDHERLD